MMKNLEKSTIYFINKIIIVTLVSSSTLLYFVDLTHPLEYLAEILIRTYILFVASSMGHEGSHDNLGTTPKENNFWSRLSFLPIAIPHITLKITHRYHHAYTNIEGKDPDLILKMNNFWEFPFRALYMPHSWILWLKRNNMINKKFIIEIIFTYITYIIFYGTIAYFVGVERVLYSLVPAQVLNSFLVWYPFALKTHEGHSTGPQEERSHNYLGSFWFWFSFGLSMHRVHHMNPRKSWLELRPMIQPAGIKEQLLMKRDIISAKSSSYRVERSI